MSYRIRSEQEIISELGEIPFCQCKDINGNNCGMKVIISPNRYPRYKLRGYPKFLPGHHMFGKKRPDHSKAMTGSGNPMFGNQREDLQIKFKGEGNPMFGEVPWNKNKPWEQEVRDKISESRLKFFELHPEAREKLTEERKEYHRTHPEHQKGDLNPAKRSEVKAKMAESMKEFYLLHPERIKVGEEHWSYGKPSPKLHMFSALDHLLNDKYCRLFTQTLREQVRFRDNYTCQNCNITQEEHKLKTGKVLSVHHIHYDKPNCYPDLITLCNICNIKANNNQDYWEQFYMNKLNDRNLLFWTKNRNKFEASTESTPTNNINLVNEIDPITRELYGFVSANIDTSSFARRPSEYKNVPDLKPTTFETWKSSPSGHSSNYDKEISDKIIGIHSEQ